MRILIKHCKGCSYLVKTTRLLQMIQPKLKIQKLSQIIETELIGIWDHKRIKLNQHQL